MKFIPGFKPPADAGQSALWFIFNQGRLLVSARKGAWCIPDSAAIAQAALTPARKLFFGVLDDQLCYAAGCNDGQTPSGALEWKELRALFGLMEEDLIWVAGRANQLVDWDQGHRYCGRCGHLTKDKADERAKSCPRCGLINYPRLSPAVIVAVLRDDLILLARNKRFKGGFYSVLAGFVEPGETLEACVAREIQEEVGIDVKHIRYFGSQPWPFPNSLMIAFVAEYDGGQIAVDSSEILEAAWFSSKTLPQIPPKISIARQLIDWFVASRTEPMSSEP
jgi:NAD+ diphosphatase